MIIVSNTSFDISTIVNDYPENSTQQQLLEKMAESRDTYKYDNVSQLKFELDYRGKIVDSAIGLNKSGLAFSTFKDSKCNPEYWIRTDNGGFIKKVGVKSGSAISDIYKSGKSYATECATAIMIIYYKALLDICKEDLFNKLFPEIYLMDWDVREPLLKEAAAPKAVTEILLGDRGYFSNPDFNPKTPEWMGENVIVLPDSMYYGHGIGIAAADTIIDALNSRRTEGASQSAYLEDSVGRPNFKKLANAIYNLSGQASPLVWRPFPVPYSSR